MKNHEKKMSMMIGALKALDFIKKNPNADIEKIIRHVMTEIQNKCEDKVSAIAGASKAIEIRQKDSKINDRAIAQRIMEEGDSIVGLDREF